MNFTAWANSVIKKLNWVDVALIEFSCIAFGLLLAALFPGLREIGVGWLLMAVVLFAVRPIHKAFAT
jgi:hypothetical protein